MVEKQEDPTSVSNVVVAPADESNEASEEVVVTWDGPEDPENPLCWPWRRKWTVTVLVSCFTFLSPFSSTMVAPVLDAIGDELGIAGGDSFARPLVMVIFLLGYAQGPFVLAPLSELYGRARVLQGANLVYLAFNTACGFARTPSQMLAFRFLSGVGGSAPQAICNGVLADVWAKEERGKGQAIYGALTFIGPTVAPIAGAYIAAGASWRWVFWAASLLGAAVQVAAVLALRETYAPAILARKAARRRKATGHLAVRSALAPPAAAAAAGMVRRRLVLPFVMLAAHPAVQLASLYRAFLYGLMYLVLSTFGQVWEGQYGLSKTTASLHYLALCLGFLVGLQISHPLMDGLYARFQKRSGTADGVPEWRVPPMLLGGLLAPAGLAGYGWAAQARAPWPAVDLACAVLAAGLIVAFQSAQAYVTDAYGPAHAASAAAAGALLRTLCGFAFPLGAPALYGALGWGWGCAVLAAAALLVGVPVPALFWWGGAWLRARSTAGLV